MTDNELDPRRRLSHWFSDEVVLCWTIAAIGLAIGGVSFLLGKAVIGWGVLSGLYFVMGAVSLIASLANTRNRADRSALWDHLPVATTVEWPAGRRAARKLRVSFVVDHPADVPARRIHPVGKDEDQLSARAHL
jgi:hypothetical protein